MKRTAQKKSAFEAPSLQESELRYRRLFEAAQDGILILDAETGAITDVNPFLVQMLGYTRDEFIQKKLWEVGAFQDIQANREAFLALQKNEYIRYEDLPLRTKDGRLIPVEFVSNVYQAGGDHVIQCNIRDISGRKRAHDTLRKSVARLREQSVRDHLTGLFNRRYMEETLDREMIRATRRKLALGVIMLDVDDFKRFNDAHGHAVGDAVLRGLGDLLHKHVRGEDVPCRFGGDEFIIVMPGASREVTVERARLLGRYARRLRFQIGGRALEPVTLCLGVAVFPEDGSTSAEVLIAADRDLYRAKRERHGPATLAETSPHPRIELRGLQKKSHLDQ